MHQSTPSSPPVITCKSTADFLAALPELAGFRATNSLFVAFFDGRRAGSAMRLDLPDDETPAQLAPYLDFLVSSVRGVGETTGADSAPAIAISSARTFAESDGPPWRTLARRIDRRLKRDGMRPRELCCIAPDGWISFLDPGAPLSGRPLEEITRNPIARSVHERGGPVPDLDRLGELPEADPQRATEVERAIAALPPLDLPSTGAAPPPPPVLGGPSVASASTVRVPVPVPSIPAAGVQGVSTPGADMRGADAGAFVATPEDVQAVLAHPAIAEAHEVSCALRRQGQPLSVGSTAKLARCAGAPGTFTFIALGILTRPGFPVEIAAEHGVEKLLGIEPDIDSDPDSAPRAGWSVRRILSDISPAFSDRPRLPAVQEHVGRAAAETPEHLRTGLLALSAWLWWLRGVHSVAFRQLEIARRLRAEDPLVEAIALVTRRSVHAEMLAPRAARRRAA